MNLKKSNYFSKDELHLHCPICKDEYTHLIEIKPGQIEGRLSVTLCFECESGHTFEHNIFNHEGFTLIN